MTEGIIAGAVGVLVSILLETVPYVRENWSRRQFKAVILLALHVGTPVIIWLLHCYLDLPFPFPITCTYDGLIQLGWLGTTAFASNQATYLAVSKNLPNVKARHLDLGEKLILRRLAYLGHVAPEGKWQWEGVLREADKLFEKGLVDIEYLHGPVLTDKGHFYAKLLGGGIDTLSKEALDQRHSTARDRGYG
jgi:hypothetical protein